MKRHLNETMNKIKAKQRTMIWVTFGPHSSPFFYSVSGKLNCHVIVCNCSYNMFFTYLFDIIALTGNKWSIKWRYFCNSIINQSKFWHLKNSFWMGNIKPSYDKKQTFCHFYVLDSYFFDENILFKQSFNIF